MIYLTGNGGAGDKVRPKPPRVAADTEDAPVAATAAATDDTVVATAAATVYVSLEM